jgi:hypothetical protein
MCLLTPPRRHVWGKPVCASTRLGYGVQPNILARAPIGP